MSVRTHVLQLLVLIMGLAKCFTWDIIVSEDNHLQFYNNGTLTLTEEITSANVISSIIYDPVHYRVLFVDSHGGVKRINSFDLLTRNIQTLVTRTTTFLRIAYDLVTEILFLQEGVYSIYSYSLNPASTNKAVNVNLVALLNSACMNIAVDSCGGYIYGISHSDIARVRFNGSEREVLIHSYGYERYNIAIDQQTQKMYWTERIEGDDYQVSIESADLNGLNRKTLYTVTNEYNVNSLTVSKDFIYWYGRNQHGIFQLSKYHPHQKAKLFLTTHEYTVHYKVIAANYTTKDQLKENKNCENLNRLIPNEPEPDSIYVLCVHGIKVTGESRCECTQGYTGEKCDIFVCQNYCLQGNCSVSAEGQPKCSCKAGYSGQRCEVNACHGYCLNSGVCSLNEQDAPVCQCTADFEGETCGVSICKDYCFQGNCSVNAKGQPICSCKAGYSGQRCEINACHGYCVNSGVCSLNKEDRPVCQCTIDYEGERCGVPICKDYCFQGNCNVNAEGQPICSCTGGYSGKRCEFNACQRYCLNNGVCFLNEEEQTVCQCTADYEGERCDIAFTHIGIDGDNMTQQIQKELRSKVKEVIKEELQNTLRSEMKQVIIEELQYTLNSEVKQVIKEELQSTLHSEVNQVQIIKEDLQRTLRFFSDKNDENEAEIQKCKKSINNLENFGVALENHDEITSKTVASNTFLEKN